MLIKTATLSCPSTYCRASATYKALSSFRVAVPRVSVTLASFAVRQV